MCVHECASVCVREHVCVPANVCVRACAFVCFGLNGIFEVILVAIVYTSCLEQFG